MILMFKRIRRRVLLLAIAGAVSIGAVGCTGESEGSDDLQVIAAFYPLAWLSEQVGGDLVEVTSLTSPGQEPHDLEMSLAGMRNLGNADLAVALADFQPAVDEALAERDGPIVDAADLIDLLPLGDHAEEHEHEEDHHSGDHDLHFWLDPLRMATVAEGIADALAGLDPENAADYRSRAEALTGELTDLDAEYQAGLAQCATRTVVVHHEAFGYLADRYDLHFHGITGLTPGAEPSPHYVGQLHDLIRDEQITTVFAERLAGSELADTLASDLGLKVAVLDPIEGLTDETSEDDWFSLMRANLAALAEANQCR